MHRLTHIILAPMSPNKINCHFPENRLCGCARNRKMVQLAWKYLESRAYSHFSSMKLTLIWAHNRPFKLVILSKNKQKWPKMRKMSNLCWPLRAQVPIDSSEIKYEYALLSEYFQASWTVFRYLAYPQSRFSGKWQFILLGDIGAGMIWVKRCMTSSNHSYFMAAFYLKWFGPEMDPNERGNSFLPPLYISLVTSLCGVGFASTISTRWALRARPACSASYPGQNLLFISSSAAREFTKQVLCQSSGAAVW
jgi:hypothetical protein